MSIKAKLKTKTPCEVVLECEVGRDILDSSYEHIYKEQSAYIQIPGFRPGKAPRNLIEQNYKKEIQSYALEDLIKKIIHSVVKQNRLEPVTGASLAEEVSFPDEGSLNFTVEFEVAPVVKLPEYKGIKLAKRKVEITDEIVEATIQRLLEQHSTLEDIIDDRPAAMSDWLIVDYSGTADKEEVFSRKDAWIEINPERKIPIEGFAEQLKGAKKGETVTFQMTAPADLPITQAAGKKIDFTVLIKNIRELKKPELNDALAAKIDPKCKSVDELNEAVRKNELQNKDSEENRRLRELAAEELVRKTDIPLPPSLLQKRTRGLVENEARQRMQKGESEEVIKEDIENIQKQMAEIAEQQLKREYILDAVARAEKITVEKEDLLPQLYYYANIFRRDVAWVTKMFERDGRINELYSTALDGKALDLVLANADITEK